MARIPPILRIGLFLASLITGLALLSFAFPYGVAIENAPVLLYVGLALIAGGVWALLPTQLKHSNEGSDVFLAAVILGLIMRGALFLSTPVLEDDSYRYLWDGAVTANGLDPYKFAPADAAPAPLFTSVPVQEAPSDLRALRGLAAEHPEPHSRINYPFVSTIYPPLTQAAFALAYAIDPFGLAGWRAVLLGADLASLFMLIKLLGAYGRSRIWALMYWWNPVVILQSFGAAHMDLLVLPFLLLALWLARETRIIWAVLALAGAAAVKLWPVLLFPLIVRPLLRRPVKLLLAGAVFAVTVTLALLPQLLHAIDPDAGLNAYASDWRTHAFLFALLEDVVFAALDQSGQIARLMIAAGLVVLTGVLALRYASETDRLPVLSTIVIAALIFLSPTGYPWYLIWLAPFLALVPNAGLLCLTAMAPLYWLRFQLGDETALYQWGIVPLAFGVPLFLIFHSLYKRTANDERRHHYSSPE